MATLITDLSTFNPALLTMSEPKDGNNQSIYADFFYEYPSGKSDKLQVVLPQLSTWKLTLGKNKWGRMTMQALVHYERKVPKHVEIVKFYDALHSRIIELMEARADKFGIKPVKANKTSGIPAQDVRTQLLMVLPRQKFYKVPTTEDGEEDMEKDYSSFLQFIYNETNKSNPNKPPYISAAYTSAKTPQTMDKYADKSIVFTPTMQLGRVVKGANWGLHLDCKSARIWKVSEPERENPYKDFEGEEDPSVANFGSPKATRWGEDDGRSVSAFGEAVPVSSSTMLDVPS